MEVEFSVLRRQYQRYEKEWEEAGLRVMRSGQYILGEEVRKFENEFAKYLGVRHCVGVGNGLDALRLALEGLGIGAGDEVIVPANTFIGFGCVRDGSKTCLCRCRFIFWNLCKRDRKGGHKEYKSSYGGTSIRAAM